MMLQIGIIFGVLFLFGLVKAKLGITTEKNYEEDYTKHHHYYHQRFHNNDQDFSLPSNENEQNHEHGERDFDFGCEDDESRYY